MINIRKFDTYNRRKDTNELIFEWAGRGERRPDRQQMSPRGLGNRRGCIRQTYGSSAVRIGQSKTRAIDEPGTYHEGRKLPDYYGDVDLLLRRDTRRRGALVNVSPLSQPSRQVNFPLRHDHPI